MFEAIIWKTRKIIIHRAKDDLKKLNHSTIETYSGLQRHQPVKNQIYDTCSTPTKYRFGQLSFGLCLIRRCGHIWQCIESGDHVDERDYGLDCAALMAIAHCLKFNKLCAIIDVQSRLVASRVPCISPRKLTKTPILPKNFERQGEARSFVDQRQVTCIAGDGGDGSVSFRREAGVCFGGPDGGDGGNGGHVIFKANPIVKDLSRLPNRIIAQDGQIGRAKCCDGRSAGHRIVDVPPGTIFRDLQSNKVVADLRNENAIFLAARGGAGGHGNHFYKSNEVRVPLKAELGGKGEATNYMAEMRIMATAGLIGYPNAGKSSLLRAISRAKPKVACYPFTTLTAHVGIVHYEDYVQIAVADIPGLIEGSHTDAGLGHGFLRHVARCQCLFFVLDFTIGQFKEQYESLKLELDAHEKGLSQRPSTIIINKIDLAPNNFEKSVIQEAFCDKKIHWISAKYGHGLQHLLVYLRQIFDEQQSACEISQCDDY